MSKEKEQHDKSGKKAPEKSLKEKRADKVAKRDGKNKEPSIDVALFSKGKQTK
jgi:hypothetical protein